MNTQEKFDNLINLGLEIKAVAKEKFPPYCSFKKLTDKVEIYVQGYDNFMVKNESLEIIYWYNPFKLSITNTDLDFVFDTALSDFGEALEILKGMESQVAQLKNERKDYLLRELELLENNPF